MRTRHTDDVASMLAELAKETYGLDFKFVVSPTHGGILLGQLVAGILNMYANHEIYFAYSDKRAGHRVLRRGFSKSMKGQKVLLVDDIVTTGSTLVAMGQTVSRSGADVIGAAVICDRGKVRTLRYFLPGKDGMVTGTAVEMSIAPLIELDLQTFSPNDCPFCKMGKPVDVDLGQGDELDPFTGKLLV
jgi:orotate phosphoribosyltransferase